MREYMQSCNHAVMHFLFLNLNLAILKMRAAVIFMEKLTKKLKSTILILCLKGTELMVR